MDLKKRLADPLLLKEFRTRMRAKTVLVVELLYIIGICGIMFLGFLFVRSLDETPGWELGSSLFQTIVYIQALLMFFLSPLVAASAISGEKEQKTFDSLCVTPVSVRRMVLTKLAAALAPFFVLIGISLPFACASFILGGVAPSTLLKAYLLTFAATSAAGAVGLYWSTRFDRSIASIPASAVSAGLVILAGNILSDGCHSLASVSPMVFLQMLFADSSVPFFGRTCPFWVPSGTLLLMAFFCVTTAATIRMRFARERQYVLFRFLAYATFVCAALFVAGEMAAPSEDARSARGEISGVMGVLAGALVVIGPWVGANMPVIRSAGVGKRRSAIGRIVAAVLTRPGSFVALLLISAAPILAAVIRVAGEANISGGMIWLAFAGVVGLSSLTWTRLSFRLADRKTTKGRFIGMAVAYLVTASLVLAPLLVVGLVWTNNGKDVPVAGQYALLISPFSGIGVIADPFATAKQLKDVVAAMGQYGPLLITTGFYVVLNAILFLRWKRREPVAP